MINTIFHHAEEYTWYLDDMLIFSGNTPAKDQAILAKILPFCM